MMKNNLLNTIGFYISRTQAKMQYHFLQKLKPYGVTPEQWVLYASLSEEEGISLTELAKVSLRDKPYTTRLVDKLEEKGLILRIKSNDDKRSSSIFLTRDGAKLKEKIIPIIAELNQWSLVAMSEEEIGLLKFLLNKMYDHIK
ncbi:MAG TPA: MarR family transcriptional regulator [Candidatus Wallbacteria bacterium]|nr:MarR family transcriptional regulator [Candidatus Wallbacteria bacterium]